MGMTSVFDLTEVLDIVDGAVVGPAWTDDRCRELLRALRKTCAAAPDSFEAEEQPGDLLVAARIFHEVLDLNRTAERWPLFAVGSSRHSLYKAAVLHALDDPDLVALLRLTDASALTAVNVARWMLRLRQQTSATMVFVSPPPSRVPGQRSAPKRDLLPAC